MADQTVQEKAGEKMMMKEAREPDLIYGPEDIIGEEIEFEILPEAFSAHLHCPDCDIEMKEVSAIRNLADGKFTVSYEVYECPSCKRRFLNAEQAGRFSSILLLERLLEEKGASAEGDVLFDGRDFFVRLPLARELARRWGCSPEIASVKP